MIKNNKNFRNFVKVTSKRNTHYNKIPEFFFFLDVREHVLLFDQIAINS